jgi:hypothetical protein
LSRVSYAKTDSHPTDIPLDGLLAKHQP